jgi:hypothetical protein
MGVLETMARTDLAALLDRVAAAYRPGALEACSAVDPEWREALERAEHEAGKALRELRAADAALARWRDALAELTRRWARVTGPGDRTEIADGTEVAVLEEVA